MSEKKNIPELRFPGFSIDWESIQLNKLLEFKNGINASKEQYGRGTKFINVLDILENDFIIYDRIIGSVDVDDKILSKNAVNYGDILFQRSSETREEVGTACVYLDKEKTATFGGFVIRGKKIGEYEPVFLNYLLKTDSSRREITSRAGGSTRYNVGQETLASVNIISPTIPEQQKIASFFTAIDKKISQLKQKKTLLEQYKKGVMQKIFSQEIRFRDDNGQEFPKWEKKRLGELYDITSSKRVFQNEWTSSGVPFYRAREIVVLSEKGAVDNELFISEAMFEEYKQKYGIPLTDDLLVTGVGTLGRLYVVKNKDKFYFKDGNIIWLKKNSETNSQFVKFLFETTIVKKQIDANNSITTVGTYTIDSAKKTTIPYPTVKEQTKIANFLSSLDNKIKHTQTQIEKAEHWKKGLLQKMFV